jgi:hypothetical protein
MQALCKQFMTASRVQRVIVRQHASRGAMNPTTFARLIDVSASTLRRWCDAYAVYLSPGANPPRGKVMILSDHDRRVLALVASMRNMGHEQPDILARLDELRGNEWRALPELPSEWGGVGESVAVDVAASRAADLAQLAVLQSELQHTRLALQDALQRAEKLESELDSLRTETSASERASDARIHSLEVELTAARGEVRELQARLAAYAITGGDKPIPVAVIVAVALLAGAVLVALAFILARVLMRSGIQRRKR